MRVYWVYYHFSRHGAIELRRFIRDVDQVFSGAFHVLRHLLNIGYLMKRYGYSTIPFLVAFILSPIAEKSFYQALLLADGSYLTFITRPISGVLFFLSVLALVAPAVKKLLKGKTLPTVVEDNHD